MYKLFLIVDVKHNRNIVRKVNAEYIFEYEDIEDEELLSLMKIRNCKEGTYIICEYSSDGKYLGTVGTVFYYYDDKYGPAVDCAEWDYRVMGDVLNNPIDEKIAKDPKYKYRFTF